MQSGRTVKELVKILEKNKFANKSLSKDTIRVAINTLKKAGCVISRPTKANDYKYELLSHPFTFNLTEEELNVLLRLRDKSIQEMEWNDILILNDVYEKIVSLTCNEIQINQELETRPLLNINRNILKEVLNPNIIGKRVQLVYDSPKYGDEELDVVPAKVSYENEHLHLWCYIFKYKENSLLNIERIKKINFVDISKEIETSKIYDVTYLVTGASFKIFEPDEFEAVIEKTKDSIKVLAHVENEFYFIQRLLLLGSDFKIISPDFFREKLINKIKLIQKGYEE